MDISDVEFSVDGRRYALRLSRFPHGWAIACGPAGVKESVLGDVAADAWLNDAPRLVTLLEQKSGWDHDGLHSFAYPHEDPEEGRRTVQLQAFERVEQVAEGFFERFMSEFGLACLGAAKRFGDPDSWEELRPRLEGLRARAADADAGLLSAGEAFAAEGRWTEALFTARKFLERAPESPGAWSVQGRALAALDRAEEAERSLDQALLLAPDDGAALSARAALRLRRKDEAGALRDLEALLKVLPAGPRRDALLIEARDLRTRPMKKNGFTLIELMIVVAIIGILAAIAIPKFAELIRKSSEGSVKGSFWTSD